MAKLGKLFILFIAIVISSTACSGPKYFEAVQPTDDNSILYVYRSKVKGVLFQPLSSSYPDLILDGESVDVLKANTHRAIPIKPGKHHLRVTGLTKKAKWDQKDKELSFKIKPGEIKYLKINVQYDIDEINHVSTMNKRAIYITPVDAEDAIYEIRETTKAE
ncbi:MAG: hypothetical protein DRQ42_02080 [Gammaproteobacteria bacterium]|nr:MAG: hypothetical protein DRQ42_02080 [Gammaproteobacteria bacterium]